MQPVGGCAGLHTSRKTAAQSRVVNSCSHRPGQPTETPHWASSVYKQLWAAAAASQQRRRSDTRPWQQSLSIGAGLGAAALGGAGSGGSGPPGSGRWGSSGDDSSWGHSHGGSGGPGSNVLADVAAAGAEIADAAVEDVILLDVGGMKCGGCVGHVKQLLEAHASVSAATVNLATETALVRVKLQPGTDIATVAAELAKALTAAGFPAAVSKKKITAAMSAQ